MNFVDIPLRAMKENRKKKCKPHPSQDKVIYALLKRVETIVEKTWMCYDKQMDILVLFALFLLALILLDVVQKKRI